jgi:dTDP-4-dehydrorhamnose reductase
MNDSNIIIIGANGQLGLALQAQYPGAVAVDSDKLDITDWRSVEAFNWTNIKIILNAAAYTNVDGAETTEGRIVSWSVNASGVRNLAAIAQLHNFTLLHISSDYVFDGRQAIHTEDEPLSPLSVYGQAKAAGDIAASLVEKHYILRTTWVIGEGKNFVRTMLGLAEKNISPTVIHDQIGRLTFTSELVRIIDHLLTTNAAFGTYNATNDGPVVSWADITRKVFELSGHTDLTVTNTTTAEYFKDKQDIAPRPLNSEMDLAKLKSTGFVPRDWREDLSEYVRGQ